MLPSLFSASLEFIIETISKNTVVIFSYRLSDESGKELEQTGEGEPTLYLHGHGNVLRGLEDALENKAAGEEVSVTLPPERAYGLVRPDAVQRVPIKHLVTKAKRYRPGMIVRVNTDQGARDVTIIKVGKFNVDVDLNHPYAGRELTFDIKIESLREATAEEIAHGHVHGIDGGAHHH